MALIKRFAVFATALCVVACSNKNPEEKVFTREFEQNRVITLAPHLAELVCELGACDQLVGVSAYSEVPQQVQTLPQVSDAFSINPEIILSLKPTHIFVWDGGNRPEQIEQLKKLNGMRAEIIPIRTDSLDDIPAALLTIGGWLGEEDVACKKDQQFRAQLTEIQQTYSNRSDDSGRDAFLVISQRPLFVSGGRGFLHEAMQLCGLTNLFADSDRPGLPVSIESLLGKNAHWIINGSDGDLTGLTPESVQEIRVDNGDLGRPSVSLLGHISGLCERVK